MKPIVASADSVKSTLDKGIMSAYEAHVRRQQEREQQRQKEQEQRALNQQNTANGHGKNTAARKSSSSPAESTGPQTKVPDERQQQKDKERLQKQIENFMRSSSSLLQTSVSSTYFGACNDKIIAIRSSALCSTCSGRSERYFTQSGNAKISLRLPRHH